MDFAMQKRCSKLLIVLSLLTLDKALSFTLTPSQRMLSTITGKHNVDSLHSPRKHKPSQLLQMKDLSCAYWFNVGDTVKVTSSVIKAGIELEGRIGCVIETWEKCDVDPTCCCAEFVDDNFAVTVKFEGKLDSPEEEEEFIKGINTFTHFFNEDELVKVKEEVKGNDTVSSVAFDGMSCKAFKLDQLKMGQQAKRIAEFEASRRDQ